MKRKYQAKYDAMVVAVASGSTMTDWCKSTGTPYSTAAGWSQTAEFQAAVRAIQKERLDAYVGKLIDAAGELADSLLTLVRHADSQHVKLGAIRGAAEDLVKIASFAQLKGEMDQLRAEIKRLSEGKADVVG